MSEPHEVRVDVGKGEEISKQLRSATGLIFWNEKREQAIKSPQFFETHLLVIRSLVSIIPDLTLDQQRQLVEAAVFDLHRANHDSVSEFTSILRRKVQEHLNRPLNSYTIVFPLNIKNDQATEVQVLGVRLTPATWHDVEAKFDTRGWSTEAEISRIDFGEMQRNSVPLVVSGQGRDEHEAFRNANDVFHLWRSAYNLLDLEGSYLLMMGTRNLGPLLASPAYGVFKPTGEHLANYFSPPPRRYKRVDISTDYVSLTSDLLKEVGTELASEIQRLLLAGIRMYGHAVDTADPADAFLNLWRALELITFKETDQRYDMMVVAKRAGALLENDELAKAALVALSKLRNDLVHRGKFAERGLVELEQLRKFVEAALRSLRVLASDCPTWKELDAFYGYAPSSATPGGRRTLATKRRVLGMILKRFAPNEGTTT